MENPFQGLNESMHSNKQLLLELKQEIQELKSRQNKSVNVDRYIDKKEAASIAGVSLSTINNWRRAKKMKIYYFDSVVRFHLGEFLEFLSSQVR